MLLKKHVLGYYCSSECSAFKPTFNTDSVEASDSDEFLAENLGPTVLTEHAETSDEDGFLMKDPTYITHSIESSDPDEFIVNVGLNREVVDINHNNDKFNREPTKITFTVESSDDDGFWIS